jgi:lysine 2,3-aminomutase
MKQYMEVLKSLLKGSSEDLDPFSKQRIKRYYPQIKAKDWNDWKWQIQNRITTIKQLQIIIKDLTEDEIKAIENGASISITPYYAILASLHKEIRRCVIPLSDELILHNDESNDPLKEDNNKGTECLVHKYPDRVLFLATNFCSTYCRFCTRSRMVDCKHKSNITMDKWKEAIEYIKNHPEVRDVLISGGDPLTLPNKSIEWLLSNIRKIPHVEFLRIGTKVPMVLPQRLNDKELLKILKTYKPWVSIHCTHPVELTKEAKKAFNQLADLGLPLGSQTVLMKDINDNVDVLRKLFHGLLQVRTKPYYLYSADRIKGSKHFRVPINKGIEIIEQLRGWTTGYAVPQFIVDSEEGKIAVSPDNIISMTEEEVVLKSYNNKQLKFEEV